MNQTAREAHDYERETLSIRKLRLEMQASLAAMDEPHRAIEIEAKLRADLAADIRKSGIRPVAVGSGK